MKRIFGITILEQNIVGSSPKCYELIRQKKKESALMVFSVSIADLADLKFGKKNFSTSS